MEDRAYLNRGITPPPHTVHEMALRQAKGVYSTCKQSRVAVDDEKQGRSRESPAPDVPNLVTERQEKVVKE